MRTLLFIFSIALCSIQANAQSLISSAGGSSDIATWSIGEVITESIRLSSSEGYFTQGFNHKYPVVEHVGILDIKDDKISFKTYPNPVADQLEVIFSDEKSYTWELYGLNGKIVQTGAANEKQNFIDFSDKEQGEYILKIVSESKSQSVIILKN